MSDSEFDLIQDFFAGLDQGASVRLGIGDDAAALSLPEGHLSTSLPIRLLRACIFWPRSRPPMWLTAA